MSPKRRAVSGEAFSPSPVATRGRAPKGSRRRCMAASTCARRNLRTARDQAAAHTRRAERKSLAQLSLGGLRLNKRSPIRSAVIAQTTSKHRVRPPAPACCCTAAPRCCTALMPAPRCSCFCRLSAVAPCLTPPGLPPCRSVTYSGTYSRTYYSASCLDKRSTRCTFLRSCTHSIGSASPVSSSCLANLAEYLSCCFSIACSAMRA